MQLIHVSVVANSLFLKHFWPSGAIAVTTGSFRFSETSLPHLLSDVICQGSETNLLQCQYSTTVSCGVTEDAAAVCQGRLQMKVTLYIRVRLLE